MASELADQARTRKGGPRRLINAGRDRGRRGGPGGGADRGAAAPAADSRGGPDAAQTADFAGRHRTHRGGVVDRPRARAAVQHAAHRVRLGGRRGEQRDSDQGVSHQGHSLQLRQPVRGTGHRRGSRRSGPVRPGSARGGGGGHAGRRLHDRGVPRQPHSRGQHLVPGAAGEAHRLLGVDQPRQPLLLHGGRPARRRAAHDQLRGAQPTCGCGGRTCRRSRSSRPIRWTCASPTC